MKSKIIKSLYKKEILDVLRDKKTVIMMLVIPLVLYPLLFVVGMQLMVRVSTGMAEHTYKVSVIGEDEALLADLMESSAEEGDSFRLVAVDDPEAALLAEEIDAYIMQTTVDGKKAYQIYYLSSVTNSGYAMDLLTNMLRRYSGVLTKERIEAAGLDPEYILQPIGINSKDISSKEASAGSILGMILPFMLVVSLLLGTMYPAIDTTAGERERGTLETILTLPISNNELIFSKFLTVATIGIVSALLNIIAMCGVGVYMFHMVEQVNGADTAFDMSRFLPAILIGVLCVFAFAVFISAMSMCFCAFAKSYKEANNYMTPLMLIVMFASFGSFLPNVTLTNHMALVPVANICLLIRDLLAFKINIGITLIVLTSNVIYGVLAILFLGKIYKSEAILFGDGSTSVQIFERRSNLKKGGVPTLGDVWLVLSVTAVAIIYIGGSIALKHSVGSLILTQFFILSLPVAAVLYSKKDFARTFRVKGCSWRAFVGGGIMIAGAICLGVIVTALAEKIFPEGAKMLQQTSGSLVFGSFFKTLLLVAILPAVCEELMFRGFVLSAFEAKLKPGVAIALSSAIFGVYHMSIVRFFPTMLLGAIICFVSYKTKSIFPGMMMHAMNNALSVVAMFYPKAVCRILPVLMKQTVNVRDGCILLAAGMILCIIGWRIVGLDKKAGCNS
ncbi:MAG: ABC transporter permease [Lachnospiraceae bacterium]|nr:ABC transporter permease [Lachnospiraceae bacterium]